MLHTTQANDTDTWSQSGRWFFSALWDQERRLVDLLVDLPHEEALSAKGCFFTDQFDQSLTVRLEAFRMLEWDTTDCYKLRCRLAEHEVEAVNLYDARVSLIFEGAYASVSLPSKPVETVVPRVGSLAACVGPLFSTRRYVSLGDYFKYYSRLGVEHFYAYVPIVAGIPAIHADLSVQNVTWILYQSSPNRFYSGQVPLMQDCHSRLRYAFDYLAYFDIDEYLVLKSTNGLHSYLNAHMPVQQAGPTQVSAITFSSWDYPAECVGDSEEFSLIDPSGKGKLHAPIWETLIWSKPTCHGHGGRTKNIVRPRFVEERNPHAVTAFTSANHTHLNAPCSIAFAKHFRLSGEDLTMKCTELVVNNL